MTREDVLKVLDEQDAAFNRHDAEGLAELYAEGVEVRDQAAGAPLHGRQELAAYVGTLLHAFPDLGWERVGVVVEGDVIVEQWRVTGTHDGDLGELAATHRPITIEGCSVQRLGADGLIAEEDNYWDEASLLRQLGALPEAATT